MRSESGGSSLTTEEGGEQRFTSTCTYGTCSICAVRGSRPDSIS